jgi:hypothetical protein
MTLGNARPLNRQHGHIITPGGNVDECKQTGFDTVQQFGCGVKWLLDQ